MPRWTLPAFLALLLATASGGAPIHICIMRVEEPALAPVSQVAWRQALEQLPALAHRLLAVDLDVEDRGSRSVADFMADCHVKPGPVDLAMALSIGSAKDRQQFESRMVAALGSVDLEHTLDYVTGGNPATDRPHAAAALAAIYEERSARFAHDIDGQPRSFPRAALLATWSEALAHQTQTDVVVTNCPLFYRPADGVALHALIRGGIVGGFTTFQGGRGGYNGSAVASTFELSSFLPAVRAVGGQGLAPEAMGRPLAAIIAHELTHLLFHLPDNYDHDRCLMHPPPGVAYDRFWFQEHPLERCARCAGPIAVHLACLEARIEERDGHLAKAMALYGKAIEKAPADAQVLNEAAWMSAVRGVELEQGLAWARRAMLAQPGSGAILDTLGWIYYRRGQTRRADAWLGRAQDVYKAHGGPDAEVEYHRACVAEALGRIAQARALGKQALKGKLSPAAVAFLQRMLAGGHTDLPAPAEASS